MSGTGDSPAGDDPSPGWRKRVDVDAGVEVLHDELDRLISIAIAVPLSLIRQSWTGPIRETVLRATRTERKSPSSYL